MGRNNIHMAIGLPKGDGVISGMRNSCQVVVEVNMTKAVHRGLPLYVSQNRVVLTPGEGKEGYLPFEYFRSVYDFKTHDYMYQAPLDYICVYDFECNCTDDKENPLKFNEIIEFPIVIVDVKTNKAVAEFHTYVRLTEEKELNPFCTELTGIKNE